MIADPHCHTLASDGMVNPAELVQAALQAHLDLIALTDHDTMASVQTTQDLGKEAGLIVVAGQEITTKWPAQTHIVGWFLSEPVRRGMSIEETAQVLSVSPGTVMRDWTLAKAWLRKEMTATN